MQAARHLKLTKVPGIAETLDWAVSLMALHQDHLDPEAVTETLGAILKDRDDIVRYAGPRVEAMVPAIAELARTSLADAQDRILARVEAMTVISEGARATAAISPQSVEDDDGQRRLA